ncbi:MAG: helix-hairpin-helix domain-containing protein, partial [Candidatus Hydrothermarchaeales archaeon]
ISYLHTIARTGELGSLYLRKGDFEVFEEVLQANQKKLLTETADFKAVWDYELMLSEIKMASFLADWINESSEEAIREKYNVAPGDVRSKIEVAVWLLYSMAELGKLTDFTKTPEIRELQTRVKMGIRPELLELVSLKGIGRVRARMLYKRGYKTLDNLKTADLQSLAKIESIGEKIAKSIIEQVTAK